MVLIAWGGRYEGAFDNGKLHGHGTKTWANENRCVRHGRGVPGVFRGGAHAQRAGAWRDGSMRQDMTDAQVCGGRRTGGFSGRERGGVLARRTPPRPGGCGGCCGVDCTGWQVRGHMGKRHAPWALHRDLGQRKQVRAARARGAWRVSGRRACPAGGSVARWQHAAGHD